MGLEKIQEFILSKGYDFDVSVINGKWQKATDKQGQKVWYVGTDHGNDFLTFSFGDYREPDKKFFFCSKTSLTSLEQAKLDKFNKHVLEDKQLRYELTKSVIDGIYSGWERDQLARPVAIESEYLRKKNLPVTGPPGTVIYPSVADNQNILVIPMRDSDGKLWNMQQIYAGGDKTFHPGARGKGCNFTFHGTGDKILIGEGFATCYAAHLATGFMTICAFNISGLESAIRETIKLGVSASDIVLLMDWDGATFKRTGKNPGLLACQKLSHKYKTAVVSPVWPGDDPDTNIDFADKTAMEIAKLCMVLVYFDDIAGLVSDEKRAELTQTPPEIEQNSSNLDKIEQNSSNLDKIEQNLLTPAEQAGLDEGVSETASQIQPKVLKVTRVGAPWVPPTHVIPTRKTGFHDTVVQGKSGVKHVPNFSDLRLAFDEKHPVVTHRESEVVYAFTGKVYEMVPELEMHAFAEQSFDPKPKNADCREFQGAITRFNVRGDEFFDTTKKINFQNGWLDLKTLEFRHHGPTPGFKSILTYDFDETALCPEFDAFLDRVLCGDPVLVQMVLEYLGYILSGDECWAAKALVLKGEGSNGKSTFLKVVRGLVGKANIMSAKISELKSEYVRQRLDGKLVNISEETPREALIDSSHFKDIVAGGTISVRAIYGTPYDLDVRAKQVFSCNDMPPSGDTSPALLRRLLIIPFNAVFTEQDADPFISERLLRELPGIFVRSLIAYLTLLKRGRFEKSVVVDAAVHEYQKSTNPVWSWIDEKVTVQDVNGPKGQVISSISGLFADFKMYCEASGYKLMNVENFSKSMGRVIPDIMQRRDIFGKKTDRFRGLRAVTRRDGSAFIEAGRSALDF